MKIPLAKLLLIEISVPVHIEHPENLLCSLSCLFPDKRHHEDGDDDGGDEGGDDGDDGDGSDDGDGDLDSPSIS